MQMCGKHFIFVTFAILCAQGTVRTPVSSPHVRPIQPQSFTAYAKIHTCIPRYISKELKCAIAHMFIHRPTRHPSQRQAILHASAVPSRIPANTVAALAAVIGSGIAGIIWITRGWRAWMPAKVSLAN